MNLRRLAIALLAAGCCAGPAAAAPVQSAVFFGNVTASSSGEPYCSDCAWPYVIDGHGVNDSATISMPGSAMVDVLTTTSWGDCHVVEGCQVVCSNHGVSQAIIQILLSGGPAPTIDLLGSGTNGNATGWGSIAYYFRLDKRVEGAPDTPVPIFLKGAGSVVGDQDFYATAKVTYQGPTGPEQRLVDRADASPAEYHYSTGEWLQPGQMSRLYMYLSGSAGGVGGHGEFQLMLDPEIQIMPGYTMFYDGHYVAASDLYTLTVSPELLQPDPPQTTPEPASLMMVGLGLIGIVRRVAGSRKSS
jgi:hypothetical protein